MQIAHELTALDLPVAEIADGIFVTELSGQHKRSLPVMLTERETGIDVRAMVAGPLDEQHDETYRFLLRRNARTGAIHFALDSDDAIELVGHWTDTGDGALDRLLGHLLTTADEAFDAILRRGFATHIEAEQRWREKNGLGPNPVGDAWRPKSDTA